MAYSTCSLNPLENESVVAELLRRTRGAVELVDASGMLPEMARSPGLQRNFADVSSRDFRKPYTRGN